MIGIATAIVTLRSVLVTLTTRGAFLVRETNVTATQSPPILAQVSSVAPAIAGVA